MSDTVRVSIRGAVAEVVLDRPERLNAINPALAAEGTRFFFPEIELGLFVTGGASGRITAPTAKPWRAMPDRL